VGRSRKKRGDAPVTDAPSPRRRRWPAWALGAAVAVAGGLAWLYGGEWPGDRRWNVLLVTFDTTRADHISCYGYRGIATPTIDGLAADGIRYARAYSVAPVTLPSHASMMTGLYPFYHGIRDNGVGPLDGNVVTLAEVLRDDGYQTAAVIGAFVLDSRFGLDQGFDLYDDDVSQMQASSKATYAERNGAAVTDRALEWLDRAGARPFFLWTHYFDPHVPYLAPGASPDAARDLRYDGEIVFADSQLGRLLQRVDAIEDSTGRPTLVVFVADHGESLDEHGEPTHEYFVYDSTVAVPLIVRRPDRAGAGTVIHQPVSVVDLYPSILEWLGVHRPREVHGQALPVSSEQDDASGKDRRYPIYFEAYAIFRRFKWSPLEGVLVGSDKYIVAPRPELYDLTADRGEERNLYVEGDPRARALQRAHSALKAARLGASTLTAGETDFDPEVAAKLRALGYVGGAGESMDDTGGLADPKDKLRLYLRVIEIFDLVGRDQLSDALGMLTDCLREEPDDEFVFAMVVSLLDRPVVHDEVIEVLLERMERPMSPPMDFVIPMRMALVLAADGRLAEARDLRERARTLDPDSAESNCGFGRLARMLDDSPAAALPYMERAHRLRPEERVYADALVGVHVEMGQYALALAVYEALLERTPDDPGTLDRCAWLAYEAGVELGTAQQRGERAVQMRPGDAGYRHTLGAVLLARGSVAEALGHLVEAVTLAPGLADAHYLLGLARDEAGDVPGAREAFRRAVESAGDPPPTWLPDARSRTD